MLRTRPSGILALAACLALIACSGDDDGGGPNASGGGAGKGGSAGKGGASAGGTGGSATGGASAGGSNTGGATSGGAGGAAGASGGSAGAGGGTAGAGASGGAAGGSGGASGGSGGSTGGSGGAAGGSGGASGGTGGAGTGGSSAAILFQSDWSTALGSTQNAVSDGGKWNIVGGQGGAVIASTGLGFPTANVLRVPWSDGWSLPRKTGMPIPAVGESRYYRWYMRLVVPDGVADSQTHPIQDGNAGSQINWELSVRHNDAGPGNFVVHYQVHTNNGFPNYQWHGPTLQKHVTYRYELHLYRNSATTFQIHPRIYNPTGVLIADDDDFHTSNNSATLASNPSLLFNNVNALDGLNSGCNGGMMPEPGLYAYQGGFCVRSDTWCGAY